MNLFPLAMAAVILGILLVLIYVGAPDEDER